MATRRYSLNPQDRMVDLTEAVGAATATKQIELTVDFTALAADGLNTTQQKLAVIEALENFKSYITRGIWPPA